MKIDNYSENMNQINNMDIASRKQANAEDKSVQDDPGKVSGTDAKIDISSASVDYSRAAEEMEKVPEERAKKIESLKNEVENDTYHVDSQKIAEKMVAESLSDIIES